MDGKQLRTCNILTMLAGITLCFILPIVSGETKSACFSAANKTLSMDCGPGHLLHITRAFYGFSPTGQCRLVEDEALGCTMDDRVHYGCVGQRSCSINLPTGHWGVTVPDCGQRSNYFQVEYTCVKASNVYDICQHTQLTSQNGYITTPDYPSNYHRQGTCDLTVTVDARQKLRLHIIDLELQPLGPTDCKDLLYFNDRLRSITLCGVRTNHTYNLHSNHLRLELQSTSRGKSKGFWLYYEAFPPLPTTLEPPQTERDNNNDVNNDGPNVISVNKNRNQSPATGGVASGQVSQQNGQAAAANQDTDDSTVPLYRNTDKEKKDKLPFAAIAGGVIGTLSLILIVLLLLLFIKWLKERKYYRAEKILEIRNPAFRSIADFHDPQSHTGYYA